MKAAPGFTMIEFMIATAVFVVVVGIAIPSFQSLIASSRVTAITNDLAAALNVARSEALNRGRNVLVCRRNSAGTDCENGTDWSAGWLVRAELSGGGTRVVKAWNPSRGSTLVGGPAAGVTFSSAGAAATAEAFTVRVSGCTGNRMNKLSVALIGNRTLTKEACP